MRRLDDDGPDALVRTAVPVNRFPDFVRELVRALRASLPAMGKVRIAQMLARAGVHLAPTTVRRIAKEQATTEPPPRETPKPTAEPSGTDAERRGPELPEAKPARAVTARAPHHVWHVDLTLVPTVTGMWVPWIPQALAQRWPFAWWVGVVLDHFSRAVVAVGVFPKEPSAAQTLALLDDAVERAGRAPKHLVSDRGTQFQTEYLAWCEQRSVRPRFGAVGQHGSIAVVERFNRSMKDEATRRILVPLSLPRMRVEVTAYSGWYNGHRPHQSLGGATPNERLAEAPPEREPIEARPRHPLAAGARRAPRLELVVRRHEGRAHLPIVELREAA